MTGICANIGPDGARLRRRAGLIAAALSVGILILLVVLDAPVVTRLLLFPSLFAAALGVLQAREKT